MATPNSDEEVQQWGEEPAYRSQPADPSTLINQIGNHIHIWTARGDFLECNVGQNPHGIPYDHVNKIFTGTDAQGHPQFATVDLQDKS